MGNVEETPPLEAFSNNLLVSCFDMGAFQLLERLLAIEENWHQINGFFLTNFDHILGMRQIKEYIRTIEEKISKSLRNIHHLKRGAKTRKMFQALFGLEEGHCELCCKPKQAVQEYHILSTSFCKINIKIYGAFYKHCLNILFLCPACHTALTLEEAKPALVSQMVRNRQKINATAITMMKEDLIKYDKYTQSMMELDAALEEEVSELIAQRLREFLKRSLTTNALHKMGDLT